MRPLSSRARPWGVLALALAACASRAGVPGQQCSFDTECAEPLVCADGYDGDRDLHRSRACGGDDDGAFFIVDVALERTGE